MTQLQMLTVRATAALGRLADLQRRAETRAAEAGKILRPALKELSEALEELQVANEHLQAQIGELASVRARLDQLAAKSEEFVQVLPLACVWTDASGVILEANEAAASLLNVARLRLAGKHLMLFVSNRASFFDALHALSSPAGGRIELAMLVRPRERRPRPVRLSAHVLKDEGRWVWFIQSLPSTDGEPAPELD